MSTFESLKQISGFNSPSGGCKKSIPQVGYRHAGPLKETVNGNKYMIVATEYVTRWAEAIPVPDKSADGIHRFVMGLVYRFGACDVLLHDQGREFNNNLVNDVCEALRISVAMSSAYHPQTNGLVML